MSFNIYLIVIGTFCSLMCGGCLKYILKTKSGAGQIIANFVGTFFTLIAFLCFGLVFGKYIENYWSLVASYMTLGTIALIVAATD